jgi:TetR/AcrR family transcriptional regulator, ethionamide resistance regulator
VPARRRRTPEAAQREIIQAAETLLRERPFRELTVDEVMRRTELSRPSFYVYFKDRHELVLRVVGTIQAELLAVARTWFDAEAESRARLHEALHGIVRVYASHGATVRALADAAADDPDVEAAYGALVQAFVDTATAHIEREIEQGTIAPLNARETARALVYMTERYLYHAFGSARDRPRSDEVAQTLIVVISRALYQS